MFTSVYFPLIGSLNLIRLIPAEGFEIMMQTPLPATRLFRNTGNGFSVTGEPL
jgi:hypothetical protein